MWLTQEWSTLKNPFEQYALKRVRSRLTIRQYSLFMCCALEYEEEMLE